jgi:hypothetical protein
MFDAAISLFGAYELHPDNKYYMQPNLQSSSPDVVAAKQTEIDNEPVLLEKTNLELVRMNEYSNTDDVVTFLKRTKFSPKKCYDSKTLIICMVSKKIQIDRLKIATELKELSPKSSVYIVGKIQDEEDKWTVFSPYPDLTKFQIFKLSETMQKYSLHDVITLHRGFVKKITTEKGEKKTTTIYDIFNIKEPDVAKFKVIK